MSTLPSAGHDRTYPLAPPADDRRFSLGLVFDLIKVLVGHGYPAITSGGDLVALQQVIYQFIYRTPVSVAADRDRVAELLDWRGPVPDGVDLEVAAVIRRIARHFAEHGCMNADPVDERLAEPPGGPVPDGVDGHRQTGRDPMGGTR